MITQTALVTGASGGIGKAFAEVLARNGFQLILVARNEEKLNKLAGYLHEKYGVRVEVIALDLSVPGHASLLYSEVKNKDLEPDVLINNAGFGDAGYFVEQSYKRIGDMIKLNVLALTELTHLFLKDMRKRGSGKILNVASTAAFQPMPRFAVYAATKAYVLHFTQALHYENRDTNIHITALCPGPTDTAFKSVARLEDSKLFDQRNVMTPQEVAEAGFRALMKNRMTVIPGMRNKLLAFLSDITPWRKLLMYVSSRLMGS